MSYWTYLNGIIEIRPIGRTQAEKRYILDTVLEHLPLVTGSERDMDIYVIQKNGYSSYSSCDEFGMRTNNLVDGHGYRTRNWGALTIQDNYILVVNASLRDRMFEDTFRDFQKWLCRLAKRIDVEDVLVEVKGYDKTAIVRNTHHAYSNMFEDLSWLGDEVGDIEPNWCEYLLWDSVKKSDYPMLLAYKYFANDDNDTEVERRMRYFREE